jgi:hypothetical protein
MKRKLVGLLASVALLGSGLALAEDTQHGEGGSGMQQQPSQQQQRPMGAQAGQGQMGAKMTSGRVLKTGRREVQVQMEAGPVVQFRIDEQTQFSPPISRAADLQEGQQVRVSFEVKGNDNIARQIMPATGETGGSGLEEPMPEPLPREGGE